MLIHETISPKYCNSATPMQRSDVEDWRSDMSLFNIGFVIFPDLTQLDFTGPLQVLSRLPQSATHIVAKSEAPVPSDCGLGLVPTHTFANCPPLDLLCIPGGSYGVVRAIGDRETIDFVRRQAGGAKYVTSVCTGAFILGVAGLLKGRPATTHWAFTDLLPLVGATHKRPGSLERQRNHRGWCYLRHRFWAHCRGRNRGRHRIGSVPKVRTTCTDPTAAEDGFGRTAQWVTSTA
jgi:putative intracellular protease/amidase